MFKSIILKLREKESVLTENHGSYTTNLSKAVMLSEGDQVQIKSAFLDTTIEQNVTVETAFTATLTTCRYLTNYYEVADNAIANPFRGGAVKDAAVGDAIMDFTNIGAVGVRGPDMKRYWACKTRPNNINNRLCVGMLIQPLRANHAYGSTRQIDFTFQLEYRDPDYTGTGDAPFNRITPPISIPKTRYKNEPLGFFLTKGFNFWVRVADGTAPSQNVRLAKAWDGTGIFNMKPPVFTNNSFDTTQQDNPYLDLITDKCEIPIPAGIYSPTELSTLITDGMSSLSRPNGDIGNDYSTGKFLVDSPFLSSIYQQYFKTFNTAAPGESGVLPVEGPDNETIIYMGEAECGLFSHWGRSVDAGHDNLLGANNASLNFDENLSKLNFDVLHFPVQVPVNGANIPGVVYNPSVADQPEGPILAYSGTGIVSFEPPSFWRQLGFGPANTVIANQSSSTQLYNAGFYKDAGGNAQPLTPVYNAAAGFGRTTHTLVINTTPGTQLTAQYAGMDLVVDSVAAASGQPETWNHPFVNVAGVASSVTTPILGNTQFSGSSVNDGFYMVNIGVNLPQEMINSNELGSTNSNNLQSIVGKFYTQGNFLQDEGSGSIVYTHHGSPQLMSSLNVQILNGDGTIPANTDLGDNSTIFVEVIKPINQPVEPPNVEKK